MSVRQRQRERSMHVCSMCVFGYSGKSFSYISFYFPSPLHVCVHIISSMLVKGCIIPESVSSSMINYYYYYYYSPFNIYQHFLFLFFLPFFLSLSIYFLFNILPIRLITLLFVLTIIIFSSYGRNSSLGVLSCNRTYWHLDTFSSSRRGRACAARAWH